MISQYFCNTGLTLGSTSLDHHHNPDHHLLRNRDERKSSLRFDHAIPPLTLGLFSSSEEEKRRVSDTVLLHRQVSHSISATTSSYSNNSSVKRERDGGGEEAEVERERCSKVGGDQDQDQDQDQDLEEGSAARKKLRLSKEQSVVLEDRFKEHSSLNPKQKQTLAKQLNLQPRQVEVWFQNRRARTKLKQTEVECELLRKCCDTLTDENKRLRNEIHELKALKKTAPFYMQLPAVATLTVCPSCERVDGGGGGKNSSKSLFSIAANSHFYNSFTHPSAAC